MVLKDLFKKKSSIIKVNPIFIKNIISPLILLIITILMLCLSWRKWPDVLVDFGRELYVPWQLAQGKVLYKDILHLYGPFSQYFNSWLFRILGVSLNTLIFFNIGIIASLTYLIYRIFLELTDRLVALASGATFLLVFAFSQYVGIGNYNFVCPYSHEVTHGIFLSFLSIYLFIKYLKNRKYILLGIMGFFLGLIFLTKIEVFLAILLAEITGFILLYIAEKKKVSRIFKDLGIFILGFSLPILGFLIYFSLHIPVKEAFSFLIYQYKVALRSPIASNIFYKRILGIDNLWLNLSKLLIVLRWYVLILAGFSFIAYILKKLPNKKAKIFFFFLILGLTFFFSPFIIKKTFWFDAIRPLNLVIFILVIYLFIKFLKFHKQPQKSNWILGLLVLSIFSLSLLFKMILNIHIFHYGFALSMPASLLLVVLIIYFLPKILRTFFGNESFIRILGLVLVMLAISGYLNWCKNIYALKNYPVGSGKDMILAFDSKISVKGKCIALALKKIKEITKENDTFVVFPEGVILNYLSRRRNPIRYFEFTPPVVELVGQDKIISALDKNKPAYAILTHKDTSEHGFRFFGKNYAQKIFSWINKNYQPIYQIGSPPLKNRRFGILIEKLISKN